MDVNNGHHGIVLLRYRHNAVGTENQVFFTLVCVSAAVALGLAILVFKRKG